MRFTLRLITLAALCITAFGQATTKTAKFDEVVFSSSNSNDLIDRGNRLARYAKKVSTKSKVVIIFYNPRKGTYPLNKGQEYAEYTKGIMVNGYAIPPGRISIVHGGFREFATLEYWIVEEGGGFPKPTPEFSVKETILCPELNVAADGFRHDRAIPLKFSVLVKGSDPEVKLGYSWRTSDGAIIQGQGTNLIQVDLKGTNADRITAAVHVDGLSPECNTDGSATTAVGLFPYPFAEAQYNYSFLAALMDAMFAELSNDPSLRGHVIFYGPRKGDRREVETRIRSTKNYMVFRNFDSSRITIVHGGYRETNMVELFLVPKGVSDPKPSPSVNEKFVTFTDKKKVSGHRSGPTPRSRSKK